MQHHTLEVKGMTCGHCKTSVEGALNELAGVDRSGVDLETGKVEVSFDESKVNVAALKEAVEGQGYDIVE